MLKDKNILLVGAGNIGGAIARGMDRLVQEAGAKLVIHDIHLPKLAELRKEVSFATFDASAHDVGKMDVVILAIKPFDLEKIVDPLLKNKLSESTLVLSVLAGKSISQVKKACGHTGPVIRAMPNIAAKIHQSATGIALCDGCEDCHEVLARSIFGSIGTCSSLDEKYLNAVTGLSGSGPAYIFLVIEAMIDGGVRMGLTRRVATELAIQTVVGAGALVKEFGLHPAMLKDEVTTPAGTTIEALHHMESSSFRAILMTAIEKATRKAAEIGE